MARVAQAFAARAGSRSARSPRALEHALAQHVQVAVGELEFGWVGVLDEVDEHAGEAHGLLELGEMAGFNDVAPQPLYPNVVEQVPQHLAILTTPPARLTRASISGRGFIVWRVGPRDDQDGAGGASDEGPRDAADKNSAHAPVAA